MYARVIITQARPGRGVDEQRRLIEEQLLPLMRQQPGFCGYLALADAVSGTFMGISVWESEGPASTSVRSGSSRRATPRSSRWLFRGAAARTIFR